MLVQLPLLNFPLGSIRQSGCMMILAEHGADVFIPNEDGYNVMELASKCGNKELAEAYSSIINISKSSIDIDT